ncbi:MAG: hypothetical protein Tsb009_01810 [Planctomycetaceae bacterium]
MVLIDRMLLGTIFVVFGLNGFLGVIPVPKLEPPGAAFMELMTVSGMIYFIKVLEVIGGALVFRERTTPLGLVLLGPIVVVINLFHLFLAPASSGLGILSGMLWCFLIWSYREHFSGVWSINISKNALSESATRQAQSTS